MFLQIWRVIWLNVFVQYLYRTFLNIWIYDHQVGSTVQLQLFITGLHKIIQYVSREFHKITNWLLIDNLLYCIFTKSVGKAESELALWQSCQEETERNLLCVCLLMYPMLVWKERHKMLYYYVL